jgi:hypothetical protein
LTRKTQSGLTLYVDQLSSVIKADLSIPALTMSLPLPEILGRLEFKKIGAGEVFRLWWDKYMPSIYTENFPGADAWQFRNDMLHNFGGADKNKGPSRIALSFPELSPIEFHFINLKIGESKVTVLSARVVAQDICQAAAKWLAAPPEGFDIDRMNRTLGINFDLLEPLAKGSPVVTFREAIVGDCVELLA